MTGRRLVAIHGWAMAPSWFMPLSECLPDWKIVAEPLPGHAGAHDATIDPDAEAERLANGLSAPAIWCGWSLGAQVALAAARRRPEAVRGLLLIAATPRFTSAPDWPHGRPARELRAMRQAARHDPRGVVSGFRRLLAVGAEADRFARDDSDPPGPRAFDSGLDLLARADLRPALGAIRAPTVWLIGARDPLIGVGAVHAAAAAMPAARVVVVPAAGHAPFIADPAGCAALVSALDEETAA